MYLPNFFSFFSHIQRIGFANPKKTTLHRLVANPDRGVLNRENTVEQKKKSGSAPPTLLVQRKK